MRNHKKLLATAALIALTGCVAAKSDKPQGDTVNVSPNGPQNPQHDSTDTTFPESAPVASDEPEVIPEGINDIQEIEVRCFGYRYGVEGYPAAPDKAYRWCQESALLGNPGGQTVLAELYYSGTGVDQDYQKALYWYTLAANGRQAQAALSLFYMYFQGLGIARNNNTAFAYLSKAAELGSEDARDMLMEFTDEPAREAPDEAQIQKMLAERGIAKVAPIYPRVAQMTGIEGYVIVSYCVDREGRTTNIRVVDSAPLGVFDAASIAAAQYFRYTPELENGIPVERHGVLNKFTYELDK